MQRAIIHAEGVFHGGSGGAGGFIHAEGVRIGFPSSVPKAAPKSGPTVLARCVRVCGGDTGSNLG